MDPIVSHIEITVRDMEVAVPFYDKLLPLLGFSVAHRSSAVIVEHDKHVVSYQHPRLGIAITSPRPEFADETVHRRRPGALHHLAFKVESRADVDRLHVELQEIGANIVIHSAAGVSRVHAARLLCPVLQRSRWNQIRSRYLLDLPSAFLSGAAELAVAAEPAQPRLAVRSAGSRRPAEPGR
jgi:catechol 2,3-dioxygenase-like lactoylglutathione lyase family enzyme